MGFALEWDKVGEKIYETGTDRGVLYPQDSDGSYPKGYAWNGLTGVTESPSGADKNDIYADNIKYLSLRGAEDFGGTITCYTYPDEWASCDGSRSPVEGVIIGQQTRLPFGLCYRTIVGNDTESNDHGYKLHLVYNASASPSERAYATVNDSPEAIEFSYEFTTTPVSMTDYKPISLLTVDSTKVAADRMAALEDVLYGTAGSTDPRLPLPDEVVEILGGTSVPSVTVIPSRIEIEEGASQTLTAQVVPAGTEVTWTVSDSGTYASVNSDGKVTGVAEGTATVTATITVDGQNYTDTCAVTVSAASQG